jgi:hypothetical protein
MGEAKFATTNASVLTAFYSANLSKAALTTPSQLVSARLEAVGIRAVEIH